MSIDVLGVKYSVRLLSQREIDKRFASPGQSLDGYTDPDTATIYISRQLSPQKRIHTIRHETLHAVFGESGISWHLERMAKDKDVADYMEEFIVRTLSHTLPSVFGLK